MQYIPLQTSPFKILFLWCFLFSFFFSLTTFSSFWSFFWLRLLLILSIFFLVSSFLFCSCFLSLPLLSSLHSASSLPVFSLFPYHPPVYCIALLTLLLLPYPPHWPSGPWSAPLPPPFISPSLLSYFQSPFFLFQLFLCPSFSFISFSFFTIHLLFVLAHFCSLLLPGSCKSHFGCSVDQKGAAGEAQIGCSVAKLGCSVPQLVVRWLAVGQPEFESRLGTPWRFCPLIRQLWRYGDGPQRIYVNEWRMNVSIVQKKNKCKKSDLRPSNL